MTKQALRILQVSTYDLIGGAEKVAWNLFQTYRARGCDSWLAVGHKLGDDPNVLLVPNHAHRATWSRFWLAVHARLRWAGAPSPNHSRLDNLVRSLAEPGSALDEYRGIENFRFPGAWQLLKLAPQPPDIVHCHNLHGRYFDLRTLPWLSHQAPLILTLHDAWLLSGHCAHSLDCERWKTGCGCCPYLNIDPPVRRDATGYNWRRKREIFQQSRLYVATPSRWLMQKVEQSMLGSAIVEARVIPNGIDLSMFHPADKRAVRAALNVPHDASVIVFSAYAVRHNVWKDYETARAAVTSVSQRLNGQRLLFIVLGEDARAEPLAGAEVRFVPYQNDTRVVARYYQAADVYLHAARADTFPNTVLEALACGTPVVATAVGGIPEQIEEGQTGFLVLAGDAQALAARCVEILSDDALRMNLSVQAAKQARCRFDLQRQADAYLGWYEELLERHVEERLRCAVQL